MKTLLIQFRLDEATRQHEYDCFIKRCGLESEDTIQLNVLDRLPSAEDLDGVDVMIIGGSGDYLISNGDIPDQVNAVSRILHMARAQKLPTIGICFGAQIMSQAFGGKVERDDERAELGTFEIFQHPDARLCPIFKLLPERFNVQLGHKDHMSLPEGAVLLASSEKSAIQAFTFPGEPMYALTFHPELDVEDMHFRFAQYANMYGLTEEKLQKLRETVRETTESCQSLAHFFNEIVKGKAVYLNKTPVFK